MAISLEDLQGDWGDAFLTPVDRLPYDGLTDSQRAWRDNGMVILPGFFDEALINEYCAEWLAENGGAQFDVDDVWARYKDPQGWNSCTPYMDHDVLRRLCCDRQLALKMQEIIGEPLGVHLNLSGWVSSERDWHQDQYLNPVGVGGHYVAMWCSLADVDPESGPFEWVPGSHLWPPLSMERVMGALDPSERGPQWPRASERFLTPLFEERIGECGESPVPFIGKKGDVLLWSGRLVHRGSRPVNRKLERRALIAHFSGISHRSDFPKAQRHAEGGWFFPFAASGPVR